MNLTAINESLTTITDLLIEALINPYSSRRDDHTSAGWKHYSAQDHHDLAKTHLALSDAAKDPKLAHKHAAIADYHFRRARLKKIKKYKPKEHAPVDPTSYRVADHRRKNWSRVRGASHQKIADYHKQMSKKTRRTNPDRSKEHADIAAYHISQANRKKGDWWNSLTQKQQDYYLKTHPQSKFKSTAQTKPTRPAKRKPIGNVFSKAIKRLGKTLKSFK